MAQGDPSCGRGRECGSPGPLRGSMQLDREGGRQTSKVLSATLKGFILPAAGSALQSFEPRTQHSPGFKKD